MIPTTNNDLQSEFEFGQASSRTYKLNVESQTIAGKIDQLEAVKQAVFLILSVERYQHLIYSWNYGVELKDLIGREMEYVMPELKRRIREALLQDSRVTAVNEFSFEKSGSKLHAAFTVETIYGQVQADKVVSV